MILLRFLLAFLVLLPLPAAAQPNFPKLTGRVVDDAHLLSPEQVAQLTQLSEQVQQVSSRQFVVATIPDLQGYDIADYGYQLLRAWGIGQKDANNGIILIVAPKERKLRIEVGYGLEPIMTDGLSSQIINEAIVPKFKAGDMAGGVMAGALAIGEQMKQPLEAAEQKAKQAQDAAATTSQRKNRNGGGLPIGLLVWFIILVVILVPMLARFGGRRRPGPWGAQPYRQNDSGALPIILWTIASEIGRAASHRDDDDWGGGGGGGGGWGGGGGGGGFSGGGGSGGGGGASGSW